MSLCLAFDCSCGTLSAAVVERRADANTVLSQAAEVLPRGHDARLLPFLDETLRSAGVRLADLGLLAVTVGPGSFTGVRIGLSAARALAQAGALPLAGLSTLDVLLAAAAGRTSPGERAVAGIDTRRGDAYLQLGAAATAPFVGDARALAAALDGRSGLLVGDAVHLPDELKRYGIDIRVAGDIVTPDAVAIATIAQQHEPASWQARNDAQGLPRPLYLRAAAVTMPDGRRTTAG